MVAEVIGVGAEMTDPAVLRAKVRALTEALKGSEVEVDGSSAVGTNAQRLRGALTKALQRSDIVILLGGMGASSDDITKAVVSDGLKRLLVPHHESMDRIRAAYARAGKPPPRQIDRLALMPERAVVFPGRRGLTPGCAVSAGRQFIIMLPGAEKEFVPMVQQSMLPYLAKFTGPAVNTRCVNVFGLSEAEVSSVILKKYGTLRNPEVSVHAMDGEVRIDIATKANSRTEASALSAPVIKDILGLLGEAAYGVDQEGLHSVVVGALRANRMTAAVAEAGTSGTAAILLREADPSGKVLLYEADASGRRGLSGLDLPDKLVKKYGMDSEQAAAAMAIRAKEEGKASVGIAIAGGETKKASLFFVSVAHAQNVWVKKLSLPKDTPQQKLHTVAAMAALDLARLVIAALPRQYQGANLAGPALAGKIPHVLSSLVGKPGPKQPKPAAERRGCLAALFPWRGDSVGEVIRKLVLITAVCTFFGSAAYLGNYYYQAFSNRALTEEIAGMYIEGMEEAQVKPEALANYPADYQKKFANLYSINEDIAGWVKIEDTQVNYPVVYIENDNQYYERRDFYRKSNRHGVPWLESKATLEPQSDNYIIYGHNMADGQMFGELMKYKPSVEGLSFLQAHPIISMDDVYRDNTYKIISVFITNSKPQYGDVFYYNYFTDLSNHDDFTTFVNEVLSRSYYISNVDVQPGDKFITLSTCSYEYGPVSDDAHVRTVIVGRRVRPGEKDDGSDIVYQQNPSPKFPAGFTKEASVSVSAAAANSGTSVIPVFTDAASGGRDEAGYMAVRSQVSLPPSRPGTASAGNAGADSSAVSRPPDPGGRGPVAQVMALASQIQAQQLSAAAQTEEERAASESEAARVASEAEAARLASEAEAARAESEAEAARLASEAEAAKAASEAEAIRLASEAEAARLASEAEAARLASESEAARLASEAEASRQASEQALIDKAEAAYQSSKAAEEERRRQEEEEERRKEDEWEEEDRSDGESSSRNEPDDADGSEDSGDDIAAGSGWEEKITVYSGSGKLSGPAYEVVPKIVMNEMGPSFSEEALKAQAIAVYNFVRHQNQSGVVPSLAVKEPDAKVRNACEAVRGQALYYGSSLAFTPFYATSAGVTVSSREVWGGSYPYLESVDSSVDRDVRTYEVSKEFSADTVAAKVEAKMGVDLYAYSSDPDEWFSIESYTDGGSYIKDFRVGNKTTSGRAFREIVLNLRSAAFDVSYDSSSDSFTFTTYGYGHGVGMSQTGAHQYALKGWSYREILEHYYDGTVVK